MSLSSVEAVLTAMKMTPDMSKTIRTLMKEISSVAIKITNLTQDKWMRVKRKKRRRIDMRTGRTIEKTLRNYRVRRGIR